MSWMLNNWDQYIVNRAADSAIAIQMSFTLPSGSLEMKLHWVNQIWGFYLLIKSSTSLFL